MVRQRSALLGLALSLAVLGSTACEDKTQVEIPPNIPPLSISVTPAAITIEEGSTAQLVAQVTGGETGGDKSVAWASSNTAVATVSANGNVVTVTAVAEGTATISATANADSNVKAAAVVTVTPQGGSVPPTISIKSITTGATNVPVNVNNVFGQIEITLNLDVPQGAEVSYVQLLANGEQIYCQGFNGGCPTQAASLASASADFTFDEAQSAVELVASWNTASFDASALGTQGTVQGDYENGATEITAQVVGPQGTVTANTSTNIVLNNPAFIYARLDYPAASAQNPTTGLVWYTGDIVVTAMGVKFNDVATNNLGSVSLTNTGSDVATAVDSDPSDGLKLTLQKSGGSATSRIEGLETAGVTLSMTSVTQGGTPGPTCVVTDAAPTPLNLACNATPGSVVLPAVLNWDNVAPTVAGTVTLPNPANPWISSAVALSALDDGLTYTDGGVMGNVLKLQYRPVGTTTWIDAPNGTADIPESQTNAAYDMRIVVCDALNNCANSASVTVGSDATPPTVTAATTNAANMTAVAVGTNLNFTVTDIPSGPETTPGLVTLVRRAPNVNQCQIGTAATGGGCSAPADVGAGGAFTVVLPGPDGYTDVTVQGQDNAGLTSAPLNFVHLIDVTPPTVGNIALPPTLTGGQSATFTSVATDNIDVATSQARLNFNTVALSLPFTAPTTIGTFGFDAFTTTANLSETIPFIQSIYAAGSDPSVTANGDAADAVSFRVTDFGNNASTNSQPFGQVITPGPVAALTAAEGGTFVVATPSAATTVCNMVAGTECPLTTDTPNTTVTATINGPAGSFANPFSTVYFFYNDAGGVTHFIASAAMVLTSDTGIPGDATGRQYTATITFNATGLTPQANVPIFAIGVDASGDGLLTPQNANVTIAAGN